MSKNGLGVANGCLGRDAGVSWKILKCRVFV